MSKTQDARGPEASPPPPKPLRPHRGLLVLLGIGLLLALGVLLALYFTTVYPNRNKPHAVETDTPSVNAPGRKP